MVALHDVVISLTGCSARTTAVLTRGDPSSVAREVGWPLKHPVVTALPGQGEIEMAPGQRWLPRLNHPSIKQHCDQGEDPDGGVPIQVSSARSRVTMTVTHLMRRRRQRHQQRRGYRWPSSSGGRPSPAPPGW